MKNNNNLDKKNDSDSIDLIEQDALIESILKTKSDLDIIMKNYEIADSELTDYYLYQIKATQARLDYLVRLAKTQKLKLNAIYNYKLVINY